MLTRCWVIKHGLKKTLRLFVRTFGLWSDRRLAAFTRHNCQYWNSTVEVIQFNKSQRLLWAWRLQTSYIMKCEVKVIQMHTVALHWPLCHMFHRCQERESSRWVLTLDQWTCRWNWKVTFWWLGATEALVWSWLHSWQRRLEGTLTFTPAAESLKDPAPRWAEVHKIYNTVLVQCYLKLVKCPAATIAEVKIQYERCSFSTEHRTA